MNPIILFDPLASELPKLGVPFADVFFARCFILVGFIVASLPKGRSLAPFFFPFLSKAHFNPLNDATFEF